MYSVTQVLFYVTGRTCFCSEQVQSSIWALLKDPKLNYQSYVLKILRQRYEQHCLRLISQDVTKVTLEQAMKDQSGGKV